MTAKPDPFSAQNLAGLTGRDPAAVRRRIEAMEKLLEGLIVVPGTNFRIGLDVLLDVLPVGGSMVAAAMGSWMAWEARNLGMPKSAIIRMAGNIGFDALLGIIPWIGAVPDLFFRSNTRNLKIVKAHLDKHHPGTAVIDQ
jgi:Domain of unknown function (DUF4112)